jgi:hypothetical protein
MAAVMVVEAVTLTTDLPPGFIPLAAVRAVILAMVVMATTTQTAQTVLAAVVAVDQFRAFLHSGLAAVAWVFMVKVRMEQAEFTTALTTAETEARSLVYHPISALVLGTLEGRGLSVSFGAVIKLPVPSQARMLKIITCKKLDD